MSLKSLLASMTLCVFLTSFCLAEGVPTAPGKSIPVDSITTTEEDVPLVLDSAPVEPVDFISMTDVQITALANTVEVKFTTNIPTYATIEYGLTTALESAVTTETMTAHVETLSGLTACRKYSYRVLATSAEDTNLDTAREGTFMTKGCIVKKSTPVVKKTVPAPISVTEPLVVPTVVVPPAPESEMLALPLESDIPLNAAPDEMANEKWIMYNEDELTRGETIQVLSESPDIPSFISEPIKAPVNKATEILLALLMLTLLLVALLVVRRKK